MDRAAAEGLRRAGLRSHPTAGLSGAVMSRYRTCRPAHGVYRRRSPLLPLDPPSKAPGSSSLVLKYYHDLHVISQPDKPLINIRLTCHFLQCGMWIITDFLCMHRHGLALSQVNALFWFRLACGIPSISTAYAQAWRRCAQVIHMFVHRQQGSRPAVGWQPAADRHGRRSLLVRPVRRVRVSETRWSHRPPLVGGTDVRRCRAHVVRRREPGRESACALVGTDIIKVLANRKPLPAADGCRILCLLSVAVGILVSVGAEP